MSAPTADTIAAIIGTALSAYNDQSERSQQTRIGASEVGFCRQRTAYRVKEQAPTDGRSMWAAMVGTAIHKYVSEALSSAFPEWIVENAEVTAVLPNGVEILGHPDLIVPDWNACLDVKTVDGFEWVKRNGASQTHRYQRHLYALGAIQAGLLDKDRPIHVGNVYLDRSAKQPDPFVLIEEMDYSLTDEITAWLDDVIYAVQHGEDASRDVAAPVCESISCEFYSECRGGLPTSEPVLITDPTLVGAVSMYREGLDLEKEAKRMKDQAKSMLYGVNGSTGEWQVRWTTVGATEVPGFTREGYERLDVRRVRGRV